MLGLDFLDSKVQWQKPEQTVKDLPESFSTATSGDTVATDCKSLYDLVSRTAPPACSEFRTQLNARPMKDLLAENVNLRWVHSGAQLADGLPKIMENSFLRETLQSGRYRLNDELEILKERSDSRTRLKWLRAGGNEASCNVLDHSQMPKLWVHETCRQFRDRLVNKEDRSWFDNCLAVAWLLNCSLGKLGETPADHLARGEALCGPVAAGDQCAVDEETYQDQGAKGIEAPTMAMVWNLKDGWKCGL
eukprot:s1842_g5.t1